MAAMVASPHHRNMTVMHRRHVTVPSCRVTVASHGVRTMRSAPSQRRSARMHSFLKTLEEQRWDDHRYYHQSRINQSLHLVSAISFLVAYALLFVDPALAALVGW